MIFLDALSKSDASSWGEIIFNFYMALLECVTDYLIMERILNYGPWPLYKVCFRYLHLVAICIYVIMLQLSNVMSNVIWYVLYMKWLTVQTKHLRY